MKRALAMIFCGIVAGTLFCVFAYNAITVVTQIVKAAWGVSCP